jgi:uncharacterized protein (TIGR02217 family)
MTYASFDAILFPTDISYGSAGGPEFKTELMELGGGEVQGTMRQPIHRARWNVAYGVKTDADLDALMTFFTCRRGMAAGFYFEDPLDHRNEQQSIGTGNGANRSFTIPLSKTYVSGVVTRTRTNLFISEASLEVFVGGVAGAGYEYFPATHSLLLDVAPGNGVAVAVSYDFWIKARFDSDYLTRVLADYLAGSAQVPIRELV